MSLSDLSQKLKLQAGQSGQIVLNKQTICNSNLNPPSDLDQLIRDSLGMDSNQTLTVTINPHDIPDPATEDKTLTITGQASILNVKDMTTSVEFVVENNCLNFVLRSTLEKNWRFNTSFPMLVGYPFEDLAINSPAFIISTHRVSEWTWNQKSISLKTGLNFVAFLEPNDALKPITSFLSQFSPSTPTNNSFVLSGPIDIPAGKEKNSAYPDLNLKAHISDDTFTVFFLNVGKPFVELSLVEIRDEDTSDYHPGLFLGLELTIEKDITLDAQAELIKDASFLVLSATAEGQSNSPTLANITELMAGQNLDDFVPKELKAGLAEIAFKGFAVTFSLGQEITITSVQATLGSTQGWQVFDEFQVDRFDFTWSILDPGRSNTMMGFFTTQFHFFPDVFKGAFDIEITTDLAIAGRFNGSVSINDLVGKISEGQLCIPDNFVSLSFSDFNLFLDARQKNFSLEATADAGLKLIDNEGVSLNHTRFEINAITPTGGGSKEYTGSIVGVLKISELELYMSANHPAPGQNWVFEGRTIMFGSEISFRNLAQDFLNPFDVIPLSSIPDISLTNLSVRYNTQGQDFAFACAGNLTLEQTSIQALIDIAVKRQQDDTFNKHFGGQLLLQPSAAAALAFNVSFDTAPDSKTFIAAYHDPNGTTLKIDDLISLVFDIDTTGLEFTLRDALLAHQQENGVSKWLFGLDIEGGLNLSDLKLPNLPLVGAPLPPEQTLKLAFQVLAVSATFTPEELTALNVLDSDSTLSFPQKELTGVDLAATLRLGQESRQLNLPIDLNKNDNQQSGQNGPLVAASAPPTNDNGSAAAEADVVGDDGTHWINIQKSFGPVHFERVGLKYADSIIQGLLDAALTAAGLTLSLDGLSVASNLNFSQLPTFNLRGLGIDYKNGPVEIGGALLQQENGFAGMAVIRTTQLTLSAIGAYADMQGHPSLFIYAVLDYPLGGPAFFFVTGLAAGFGYNRALTVPAIDQVATFPLVEEATRADAPKSLPAGQKAQQDTLSAELQKLESYIPPAIGEYFLAVGIKFTSFKLVDSFALLIVKFGQRLEIDLLGLSTLVSPPPIAGQTITPVAEAQLALKATFIPDEGFLGIQAQLTSNSYILSRDCHLTGGFAFFSWFSGPHAGDFVTTLGGYHPHFQVPPHYPQVPRLGINWQVNESLSIKGQAYCALTAHAIMAGGILEATWHNDYIRAWFKAGADFLINWQPYHYEANVYVGMLVQVTLELFGTLQFLVEVGADLQLWGPEFTGVAHAHLKVIGIQIAFDVEFGETASLPEPIGWGTFKDSFLPADDQICGVSVQGGLVRQIKEKQTNNGQEVEVERWIINPKDLVLVTNSVIPITEGAYETNGAKVAIAPMAVESVTTTHTITITRDGQDAETDFAYIPIHKAAPAGLWGKSDTKMVAGKTCLKPPNLNGDRFVDNTLAGFEIRPDKPPEAGTTADIKCSTLQYETEPIPDAYEWQDFTLADDQGKDAWGKAQETVLAPSTTAKRDKLLTALGFTDAMIDFGQPVTEDVLVLESKISEEK